MSLKILKLVFLSAITVACAGPLGSSNDEKESSNQETTETLGRPASENATPVEPVKALESGETWSLLTEDDVFTTKQSITVYKSAETIDSLCDLNEGIQSIILARANSYIKIRLDRIAEDESCPLDQQSVAFIKLEDFNANNEIEIESSGGLEPHRLTYDLKIFRTNDDIEQEMCSIAKGNPVLVNPSDTSIQVPFSIQCDPDYKTAYYRYRPGMWWEDQPR